MIHESILTPFEVNMTLVLINTNRVPSLTPIPLAPTCVHETLAPCGLRRKTLKIAHELVHGTNSQHEEMCALKGCEGVSAYMYTFIHKDLIQINV